MNVNYETVNIKERRELFKAFGFLALISLVVITSAFFILNSEFFPIDDLSTLETIVYSFLLASLTFSFIVIFNYALKTVKLNKKLSNKNIGEYQRYFSYSFRLLFVSILFFVPGLIVFLVK